MPAQPEPGRRRTLARAALVVASLAASAAAATVLFLLAVDMREVRQMAAAARGAGAAAGAFNVYYLGDSTMFGEPYAPELTIAKVVDRALGGTLRGRPLRSITVARPGAGFEFIGDRVEVLVRRKAELRPSLCVIYTGHNEFLKYAGPLGRSVSAMPPTVVNFAERVDAVFPSLDIDRRRLLDTAVVSPARKAATVERFAAELGRATTLLASNDIPVILSTAIANDVDFEPNRSTCSAAASVGTEFGRRLQRARQLESSGALADAAAGYRDALQLCPDMADAHYRLGQTYRALGEPSRARDELQQAIDDDGLPIRATTAINDAIRRQGAGPLVTTVDSARLMRARSDDGFVGFNLMIDAHHPNARGYLLIGTAIAREIARRFDPAATLAPVPEPEVEAAFGIGGTKQFDVAVSRGRWFTRLATWRYDPVGRLAVADRFFHRAMELEPNRFEPELGLAMVQFLRRDAVSGESHLAAARARDRDAIDRYFRESWVRQVRARAHAPAAGSLSAAMDHK